MTDLSYKRLIFSANKIWLHRKNYKYPELIMKSFEWVNDCSRITRRLSGSPEQHHCLCAGPTATAGATSKQRKTKNRNLSRAHDTQLPEQGGRCG